MQQKGYTVQCLERLLRVNVYTSGKVSKVFSQKAILNLNCIVDIREHPSSIRSVDDKVVR